MSGKSLNFKTCLLLCKKEYVNELKKKIFPDSFFQMFLINIHEYTS